MTSRIFLIGYMGSGKSTIGPLLARKLGYSFFDLDGEIEKREGKKISVIFEENGEEYFRRIETETLVHITKQMNNLVLSTGGGTPCFHENIAFMNENGTTVYIDLPPGALAQRLRGAKEERPLLKNLNEGDLQSFIARQLDERKEFYLKADIIYRPLKENMGDLIAKISLI